MACGVCVRVALIMARRYWQVGICGIGQPHIVIFIGTDRVPDSIEYHLERRLLSSPYIKDEDHLPSDSSQCTCVSGAHKKLGKTESTPFPNTSTEWGRRGLLWCPKQERSTFDWARDTRRAYPRHSGHSEPEPSDDWLASRVPGCCVRAQPREQG